MQQNNAKIPFLGVESVRYLITVEYRSKQNTFNTPFDWVP